MSDFDLYESEIEELYQKPEEPKVELTVEEAKGAIADYIDVVAEVVRKRNEPEIKIKHPKSIRLLMEKIEQAEMSKEST